MNFSKHLGTGFIVFAAALLAGCSTTRQKTALPVEPVRHVDFTEAPQLEDWSQHTREFGNEMYPRICALLLDESTPAPKRFDVIVKPFKSRDRGWAHPARKRLYVNSNDLTNQPARLDEFNHIFVHEMTHIAVQYRHWAKSFWISEVPAADYWGESIADFARFKLLGTNGWRCPECNIIYPHYTAGYTCGGAFLLYLDANYGTNIVRQLIRELRQRTYTDEFFRSATGKELGELWAEFQKTDAFKPTALVSLELRQTLGFKDGVAPKDVFPRFEKYVEQHADDFTKMVIRSTYRKGKPVNTIQELCALYLYLTQPGGSAEHWIRGLATEHALPGIRKGEKGTIAAFLDFTALESRTYPVSRTVELRKNGDPSRYHYTVSRASLEEEWKLDRAWHTSAEGKFIEEFPLPAK